jgi:signal peptidase I
MSGSEPSVLAATDVPAKQRSAWVARVRRVVLGAVDALLVAAFVVTVFVAYGVIGNRWYHVVAIEGGSMEPTITRGDLIVLTPAPTKIEPGMILTMGVDGRVVTHRVVSVGADGSIVTRGDANQANDDWNGKRITIYGQYLFTIPALGRFLPISNGSGASFIDERATAQRVEVGFWTITGPAPVAPPPSAWPPSQPIWEPPVPPIVEPPVPPTAEPSPTAEPTSPPPTVEQPPPPAAEPPVPTPEPPAPPTAEPPSTAEPTSPPPTAEPPAPSAAPPPTVEPTPTAEPETPAPSAAPPPTVEPPPTAEPETPAPPTAEPGSTAPSDAPAP